MPQVKQLKELNVAGLATKQDFFIQWHLTERCNLRCRHCYQSDGGEPAEMSLPEVVEVLDEISGTLRDWAEAYEMELSPSLNVTGGEPFLRGDIFDILHEMRGRGFEIYLLTNGTLIDKGRARALSSLGVRGVQVSIEGPEEVHEGIRGKGSYTRSISGVKNLLDAGLRVTLNVTLSNLNARYMGDLLLLALTLGVQRLGFSRLVPSGRGLALRREGLEPWQLRDIYEALLSVDLRGLEVVTGDPVASQMTSRANGDMGCTAHGGCSAGVAGLTLLPDGTITPCRRLPIPIGNIKRDSLREVWADSEVLGLLRDKASYKGKCGRCLRWAQCRGCRAIAYAYSDDKDFLAEDPHCFITEG
jgi:radical SAM protein with 4Fe4S-binding SPASM domain